MYPIYILNQERKYGFCQEKVAYKYENIRRNLITS